MTGKSKERAAFGRQLVHPSQPVPSLNLEKISPRQRGILLARRVVRLTRPGLMGANENRTGHDGSIVHAGHVMRFRGEKLRMSLPSASAYPNDRDLRAHFGRFAAHFATI
jgi:hypothetical protein